MKFALVHLTGPHKGETHYFDCSRLTLGREPGNDVIFSVDGHLETIPSQVELFEKDCRLHLRNQDTHVTTFVNRNPLFEADLHDRDLLQLGPQGPKLRFRIRPDEYAACKRSREILRDALDVASEARQDGAGLLKSFVGQLRYDVRRHASRATQIVGMGILALLLGGLVGLTYYSYMMQQTHEERFASLLKQLQSTHVTQANLAQQTIAERRRLEKALTSRQGKIEQLVAMLEAQQRKGQGASSKEVRAFNRRLQKLEKERAFAEILIKQYGPSVCFLYGAYGFLPKGHVTGEPATLLEYMGSGFLVNDKGLIVTNRHLVEPWRIDPSGMKIVNSGFHPKLVTLLAYFPGHHHPFTVTVGKVSGKGDVALGHISPIPHEIAAVPLLSGGTKSVVGEAVMVLGYPVGVEGLLARMDDQVANTLLQQNPSHSLGRLVQNIADHGGIRPLATQGHIGDMVPGRLVYDAQTTVGASGSPVFNGHGELIAVNAAFMKRFSGASFGVPIGQVLDLMASKP